jgi:hypothetical protein
MEGSFRDGGANASARARRGLKGCGLKTEVQGKDCGLNKKGSACERR